jgi:uncharacterized heparinase superfamily protein
MSPAPALRQATGPWTAPAPRPASLAAGWQVRFLNEVGEIAWPQQWNDAGRPKLWLYNLHYFDDLCAADGDARRELQRKLIARWIAENPPPRGNGWEPYPVSLRIVNWIKWHLAGEWVDQSILDSLAMQARWLEEHVEWHLLGNHILANAKALVFAGLFFSGPEADRWLEQGMALLKRELPEQILADGAHFELSPMYHAIILEDMLDLINVARYYGCADRGPLAELPDIAQRTRHWLAAMTHPDGEPAFFNDAAFGIAASRTELEAYAERLRLPPVMELGEGVHHLASSGYVRVNRGAIAAILDVGAIGPDYLLGHAHADTLSFELSNGGERVIVNGGTSTYEPGPERERQRATAAHSTVEIDDADSSEVWASFRVARRARVTDFAIETCRNTTVVRASHDGYRRLPGRNIHTRTWQIEEGRFRVIDDVTGRYHRAVARFLLAPRTRLEVAEAGRSGFIAGAGGSKLNWQCDVAATATPAQWHPEFGISVGTQCIVVPVKDGQSRVSFEW